jgi:chemotaxis protein MotB
LPQGAIVARKKKAPEHFNHERWLVSYADFITLLFAFFTTMYAISTVDAQKMGKMVMSMRASFDSGMFTQGSDHLSLTQGSGDPSSKPRENLVQNIRLSNQESGSKFSGLSGNSNGESLGRLKRNVEALVGAEALKGRVRTYLEGRGLVISMAEGGFFDSGSDIIKPDGLSLLDTIATGLASTGNQIRVEGHTDNVPIRNSKFPSNWELSTARATAVVAYLITKFGFEPVRLSAAGYAEYRPASGNDTIEGRARNRRVDIVVLNPALAQMEPPVSSLPKQSLPTQPR